METKICSKCGKQLPLTIEYFYTDKSKKGGFRNECKDCRRLYAIKNKDRIAKYNKQYNQDNKEKGIKYRQDNKDKLAKRSKQHYEENREYGLKYRKQYYRNNKDKIAKYLIENKDTISKQKNQYYKINIDKFSEYNKKYRQNNIEKFKKRDKKYQQDNKEKINNYNQKRRSKKNSLPSTLTTAQWEKCKKFFGNKCAYCGQELPLQQEHFIPLNKGGEYTRNNIIPSCKTCNCSKSDSDFGTWYPKYKSYSKTRETKILKYLGYKDNIQQLKLI